VSENDNCHRASVHYTKAGKIIKVMGRNAWRGKPSGDLGKQDAGRDMLGADCSNFQVRAAATEKAGGQACSLREWGSRSVIKASPGLEIGRVCSPVVRCCFAPLFRISLATNVRAVHSTSATTTTTIGLLARSAESGRLAVQPNRSAGHNYALQHGLLS